MSNRKYADCGHAYDGATDTGYCHACEDTLRAQMEDDVQRQREAAAELDAMREMGDERDPEDCP